MKGEKENRTENEQERFSKSFVVIVCVFTFSLLGMLLWLVSVINDYTMGTIRQRQENYMTIVHDLSLNIENEVNQTEQALGYFVRSGDFCDALHLFNQEGYTWPLNQVTLAFCVSYSQVIDNMIITKEGITKSQPIWSLKEKKYEKLSSVSFNDFARMHIFTNSTDPHDAYLGITIINTEGYHVTTMLSLSLMYERLVSHITSKEALDIVVKNRDGLVLMSATRENIARNVFDLLEEQKTDSTFEEQDILKRQMEKQSGYGLFHGSLFSNGNAKAVQKLSVYVPAVLDSGFWVVSIILDYKAVLSFINNAMFHVSLAVAMILTVLICMIFYIIITGKKKEEIENDNRHLRELNRTLQYVNENERIRNHQQRLEIIGTMTCGIAHEFNNLLTPIMGYSGMLLDKKKQDDPEYEDLKEIFSASEKAKDVIQQVSAFGRKNVDLTFHPIQVSHFLVQTSKLAKSLVSPTIHFTFTPPDTDGWFFGNNTQLYQVFLNIILNSIDAIGGKEGSIDLSYHAIPPEKPSKEKLGEGCIEIKDNGCGMDAKTVSNLFKPFFTTKAEKGGNGLGLLIASNIIKSHHGEIQVKSTVGAGSTFSVTLPLVEKPVEDETSDISSLHQPARKRLDILLVEEDLSILKFFGKGLEKQGCRVTKISNGLDAWQILKHQKYDVLVADDVLMELSGLDLSMKARLHWPNLTIVMVTSSIRKEIIDAVRNGIIDGYLPVPVTIEELMEEINDVRKS